MAYYPIAAGHPDYSGNFIPTIWSDKLNFKFYDASCARAISNQNWEGEIKDQGDKVIINNIPSVTIRDYTKGQTLQHERPEADPTELLIDQGKYWDVVLDDVDKAQSMKGFVNTWSSDASEQMKIAIDTDAFASIYADVHASNTGNSAGRKSGDISLGATGSPVTVSKVNILDYIVDCGTVLDEQNVPEDGRWFVMPAWMCGMIKKSDLKDATLSGDGTSMMRNGRLGMIDRFELYRSNLLSTYTADTATRCLFGHPNAWTFASQITKVERLRSETTFGEILRGLNVYGFKVTYPAAMGMLYATK